ncbi:hypothetical protein PR202_ga13746 [Eleusine coracana subsp. coracana]|uniref:Protein kinase domain-containing protein n=1 Tax=Eleusine coracana subsp. coracana TaxID=191504 RepID=A0AAV5CF48_ELECO|nr:hypothetical protein PR202_ga13746 [Eleusine coracana subsp. coracana]
MARARPSCFLLVIFFLSVFLALVPETTQLQSSQAWTLLKIQQLLNYPPMLSHWRRGADFCAGAGSSLSPSGSAAVVCYGDTVTQLHIAGPPGTPPLPNNFSIGAFVTTLSRLPDLKVLALSRLGLWGPLPGKLGRLPALEILNMSGNYLFSGIPRGMSRLAALQTLVLDDNLLGGAVPAWVGTQLPSLSLLSLRNNSFQGPVPASIGAMPSLRSLALASNNLSGNLPDLTRARSLQTIDVSNNALGPAFPKLGRKVVTVALSRNRFGGGLPAAADLAAFYLLERLDVSWNRFVGPFPPALLSLPAIRYLSVAGNRFTGLLSDATPCGDNLRFVDLSANLLTGTVPACLERKKPGTLVLVAENCLDGGGDAAQQHSSPFCQNQALAVGIVTPGKERKSVAGQAGFVAGVVAAVVVAVLVVGLMVFLAVRKASTKGAKERTPAMLVDDNSSNGYPSKLLADARMTPKALLLLKFASLIRATVASSLVSPVLVMLISSISCVYCQMYRGRLGNGIPVTIRTLKIKRSQTTQSLNRHIETISRLRHQHLVSALGHCLEYDLDDSTVTQLYLVFEYVQNGNLRSRISQGTEGCKLTWAQRISAAIGVAKGIQFLHGGIIPGIYENNLRITNILIDQNHVAKIGSYNIPIMAEAMKPEFDSWKGGAGAGTKFQTDSPVHSGNTDIFDFGVILLEVVSGKTITSLYEVEILKELMQWAMADEDRVRRRSFADPTVRKGCSDESLRTVMEICVRCLAKEPAQRPSVEDVLWNLQFAAQVQDDWEGDARSSDGSPSSQVIRSSRLRLSR